MDPIGKTTEAAQQDRCKRSGASACSPVSGKIRLKCWVDGDRYGIECPKGLWSVEGTELIKVIREALHYYRQYKSDGEYLSENDQRVAPATEADARHARNE